MQMPTDATLAHLRALVGFDTTSVGPNRDLIEHVANVLDGIAAAVEVVDDPEQPAKASLLARLGPEEPAGLVLSGHSDCVPVSDQQWRTDPFDLVIDSGRATGRGTTDMKGFLAAMVAAAPAIVAAQPKRPVHLAFSHDEELGALSAGLLAEKLLPHEPTLAIVGEPTSMRIVEGHKGVRGFRIMITGRAGHSSRPSLGANAAIAAARVVSFIDELAAETETSLIDDRFDPPFTTFGVGRIASGQALNVIPESAEVLFEYRPLPDDDNDVLEQRVRDFLDDQVLPDLRSRAPEATVDLFAWPPLPAMRPFDDEPARKALAAIAPDSPSGGTAAFGTDGGHFAKAGIPTVVLGPGDIDHAHTANESIALEQLVAAEDLLARVAGWAAA